MNTSNKYFGYFNCMIERMSSDETIIILHKNNDLNQPILAREIEIIVNRMVKHLMIWGLIFFSLILKIVWWLEINNQKSYLNIYI